MAVILNGKAAQPLLLQGADQMLARDTTQANKNLSATEIALRSVFLPAGTWRDGEIIRLRWSLVASPVAIVTNTVTQFFRLGANGEGASIGSDTQITTQAARPASGSSEIASHCVFEFIRSSATKIRPLNYTINAPYGQPTSAAYSGQEITVSNLDTTNQYLSLCATAAGAQTMTLAMFEAVKR